MEEVIGSNPIFSTKKARCSRAFKFMQYAVYIIYSAKCDKYYVGHTETLTNRLVEHNSGKGGTFSKTCAPWILKYSEEFDSRSLAVRREKEIKGKKSRKYIEFLIVGK